MSYKKVRQCHIIENCYMWQAQTRNLICIHTHTYGTPYLQIHYTEYYSDWLRAGRSGVESQWGRDFPPIQTSPRAHPASSKMGTGSFPGVKCGRDVLLTTHPLLMSRSWKSSYTSTHPLGHTGPLTGSLYIYTEYPFYHVPEQLSQDVLGDASFLSDKAVMLWDTIKRTPYVSMQCTYV